MSTFRSSLAIAGACLLLGGCVGTPDTPMNFFENAEQAAAARERETTLLEGVSREEACAHVTEVLMDLDCTMQEIDSRAGVFSGASSYRYVPPDWFELMGQRWSTCAGHRVSVSVREQPPGSIAVRATFDPPKPEADAGFRSLLRRSLQHRASTATAGVPTP